MKSMDNLVEIIKRLRAPDGCPWDREQTHKSVRGHLVEECAELLEAIDNDDTDEMREELGDVLMHLALHAEIASEQGRFTLDDVIAELCDKLVRRHPHVFGTEHAKNSDEVLDIWNRVKIAENKPRAKGGLFAGIPPALSALRLAKDVAKKARPEVLADALTASESGDNAENKSLQLGREIFACVEKCVVAGVEPEGALRDYIAEVKKADSARPEKQ